MISINGFNITAQIGRGTNGTVYKAEDDSGELCAIKVLNKTNEFCQQRFQNESYIMNQLNHKGIIQSKGTGTSSEGLQFMVMEYFEGVNFRTYMENYASSKLKNKVQIITKIAEAIGAVHNSGYVHRDIKPSNILINPETCEVKITDFGIVYIPESTLTQPIHIVGTPCYLSPEGFDSCKVTPAADVYSLGAMAYEFFLGQPLFDYKKLIKIQEMRSKTKNEAPKRPMEINNKFPVNLARVVNKMLNKQPKNRYIDCNEVAKALNNVIQDGLRKTRVIFKSK
ncbi:MAG: serine/threonine protein kinase [Lentisphaeraceae bacterium]|nr:serine/threonine protein kinase [Lentisphaeraceae bacterium]